MHGLDDVLRGTRCVEVARLSERLAIPVRALSELERSEAEELARALVALELPGEVPASALRMRADRILVARAILSPKALAAGRREPLFEDCDVPMTSADVDVVLEAIDRADARAFPRCSGTTKEEIAVESRSFAKRLQEHARKAHVDRQRADGLSAAEFFDVPPNQLTFWQAFYFAELSR